VRVLPEDDFIVIILIIIVVIIRIESEGEFINNNQQYTQTRYSGQKYSTGSGYGDVL
jgi:hypothetical protein